MASSLVPLAKTIMFVLSPIAVPIAKLLDRVLHEGGGDHAEGDGDDVTEGNHYNRNELSALVRIQYESQLAAKRRRKVEHERMLLRKSVETWRGDDGGGDGGAMRREDDADAMLSIERNPNATMHHDEITIVEGALKLKTKFAADACTPLNRVYALPDDTILDEAAKVGLLARGYSRVPVYHRGHAAVVVVAEAAATDDGVGPSYPEEEDISGIIGVLLVRQLIVVDSSESRPISNVELRRPSCIPPDMHLVDVINHFQASGGRGNGGLHLAIVCMRPDMAAHALERSEPVPPEAGVVGIITLEDVVEELLQEEIYDEADRDLEFSRRAVRKWRDFMRRRRRKTNGSGDGKKQFTVSFADDTTTEATPLLE
jgi:metal transporter CNNM